MCLSRHASTNGRSPGGQVSSHGNYQEDHAGGVHIGEFGGQSSGLLMVLLLLGFLVWAYTWIRDRQARRRALYGSTTDRELARARQATSARRPSMPAPALQDYSHHPMGFPSSADYYVTQQERAMARSSAENRLQETNFGGTQSYMDDRVFSSSRAPKRTSTGTQHQRGQTYEPGASARSRFANSPYSR